MLNALSTKTPIPVDSSSPPASHSTRPYGITSLVTLNNQIFALSKDSSISSLSTIHLHLGPTAIFTHPALRCDTFFIKLAAKDSLIASGSSDGVVLLLSSDSRNWGRGGVVLKGGHSREVSDVAFATGGEVCSVGDDMVVRVWRDGTGELRDEGEVGCGWGWVES